MCNKEACMWKNKENKTKLGDNGFTLVEVLASFAILLLVSQMLLFGIRFSMKMRERTELLETERRMIGTHVMNREKLYSRNIAAGVWKRSGRTRA